MIAKKRKTIVFTILFCLNMVAHAQWIPVSGLVGEPVYKIRSTSSKLFAMTGNGVLSTEISNNNWSIVPPLYLTNVIENLSSSGDTVVAFAYPDSYLSTNNGTTWSSIQNGPSNVFATVIVAGAGKLFLPTAGDYLFISTNNGSTWQQVVNGINSPNINSMSVDGNNVVLGTDDGAYLSTNGGASFTSIGLSGEFIGAIYIKNNYIFSYGTGGVKQSSNSGNSWISFDPTIPYSDITEFLVNGNKVFATTSGILMSSNLNAPTWSQVSFGTDIGFNFSICKTANEIAVGSNRGVFSSIDNGITWVSKNTGMQTLNINSLATTGLDTVYAGSSIYGVSKFNNGNWNFSGLGMLNCNHMKSRGNEVYVASDLGINRSTDGGLTWSLINNTGPSILTGYCQRLDVKDTLILGACLQSGLLRTGNNGASWTFENTGMPSALLSSVIVSGNNVIVGSYNEGLYTSTDAGFNWTQTGASGSLINDLATIDNFVFAASSNGNFLSSDFGLTWTPTTFDYYDDLYAGNGLLFASGPGYVHISRDSGQTFPDVIPAPAGVSISSLTASNDFLYIGTASNGVWKRSISEILDIEEAEMTRPFALMLPNIFTEQSTLVVEESILGQNTEMKIMDMEGRIIETMKLQSTNTTVMASKLAPATYLYSIVSAGKTIFTGKFVVGSR